MNNKTGSDDVLPDLWVKRQSKSRPDRTYYFNTMTRKSQWTHPASPEKRGKLTQNEPKPPLPPKENGISDGNIFKLSNHSKQIKKRPSKTPAQDRLLSVTEQLKNLNPTQYHFQNVTTQVKNATPAQCRLPTSPTDIRNATKKIERTESRENTVEYNKSKGDNAGKIKFQLSANNSQQTTLVKPHTVYRNESTANTFDDIPSLFPPKTPGQDRLNRLRLTLKPENKFKSLNNQSAQHALSVIKSEFGLSSETTDNSNQNANTSTDTFEPMDWEPCDIFEEVENIVVKEEFTKSYIIPDTNVFLDELSCIRDIIHNDAKYNVLVPFVVLQELDCLKGRSGDTRISNLASGAIRFIYNELKSESQRLQGQKANENSVHLIDVMNADDKILNCCLQMLRRSRETILFTNDINLCNKAITSGITTMTAKEYKAKV